MPTARTILRVAVPSPLSRPFDYLPPADCELALLRPGLRLKIPFGHTHKVGVLLNLSDRTEVPVERLRPVTALLDHRPLISEDLLRLATWASEYYHHPIGDVLTALLPTALRRGKTVAAAEAEARGPTRWYATALALAADEEAFRRAPVQGELLDRLRSRPDGLEAKALSGVAKSWRTALQALVVKGLVEQRAGPWIPPREGCAPAAEHLLNPHQSQAVKTILASRNAFGAFLLDGVTGSGKTEVYLHLIREIVDAGRQALVLVPEIALTPQLIGRFRARFNQPVALYHSGLTDNERLRAWMAAGAGKAPILIGTRSAVFAPLLRPGIIVVDEEHDASLKQQEGFRYNARDLAVMRAKYTNVPVVLGSATPSLESLYNLRQNNYRRLALPRRAGAARTPGIGLLDLRRRAMTEGLSDLLVVEIGQHLAAGAQVLLFLNRRGFAPVLICHDCGWTADCARCDAHMTLHRVSQRLRCHHCGAERPAPTHCPTCQAANLNTLGQGTQRIESALQNRFPNTTVIRVDRDSTRRKGALQDKLDNIHRSEAAILIGTQMLAKGHHFPGVTLVGVLDADRGLFGTDFRATEQMAQLIIQVAGRAGRAERPGRVLVQTHHPEHPLLRLLVTGGYPAFAKAALAERREAALPPFTRLALLRAEGQDATLPTEFLGEVRELLAHWVSAEEGSAKVQILGPAPAPLERVAGRYRAHLLFQSATRQPLHRLLKHLRPTLEAMPQARRVRWSLDVDPMDML